MVSIVSLRAAFCAGVALALAGCQSTDSGADKTAQTDSAHPAANSAAAPAARPADTAAAAAPTPASTRPTASEYRRYVGTVGTAPVVLELTLGDSCTGRYYYQRHGAPLELRAVRFRPGQPLRLRELADGRLTGTWQATQAPGSELTGTWRSPDGRRTLPFRLREQYKGAVRYQVVGWSGQGEACQTYEDRSDTTSYAADYVRILGGDVDVAVRRRLQQALGPPVAESQMQGYIDGLAREEEHSCAAHWMSLTVSLNQDYLLALATYEEDYGFGAAHPNHHVGGVAYSLRTGQLLTLDDLLLPGYAKPLRKLIAQELLTSPEYAGITSNQGWRWEDAAADSTDQEALAPLPGGGFVLGPVGVTFQYSDYEICAYSAGMPAVTLTYARLRPLIRPNGPLAPLLRPGR